MRSYGTRSRWIEHRTMGKYTSQGIRIRSVITGNEILQIGEIAALHLVRWHGLCIFRRLRDSCVLIVEEEERFIPAVI